MIAVVSGILADRDGETITIQTAGGVGYEVVVPLGVYERLPTAGAQVALHTELVVREDGWTLYGFDTGTERRVFQRLLGASGFGPRLALSLLSALGPDRTVRSIQGKDLAALSTVSGIGRKKAERLVLELHDRFADLAVAPALPTTPTRGDEAVKALTALGYAPAQADEAVRTALDEGGADDTAAVLRRALLILTAGKGGSR
ncbi:MAG TPA: Holliday junction branch migration protein RuvA [Gemmatimonadales bacterium]|nr:Holliday junction branch migration protein RuvA [Gemmatimonadales bacterium]